MSTRLHVVPLELSEANRLVAQWHRHHQPSQGHRFSLGVMDPSGVLHGAAIVGRPVARLAGSPRDAIAAAYARLGTVKAVSQETGHTRNTVKRILDQCGVARTDERAYGGGHNRLPDAVRDAVHRLHVRRTHHRRRHS